jgi:signal transduction histidine kinase
VIDPPRPLEAQIDEWVVRANLDDESAAAARTMLESVVAGAGEGWLTADAPTRTELSARLQTYGELRHRRGASYEELGAEMAGFSARIETALARELEALRDADGFPQMLRRVGHVLRSAERDALAGLLAAEKARARMLADEQTRLSRRIGHAIRAELQRALMQTELARYEATGGNGHVTDVASDAVHTLVPRTSDILTSLQILPALQPGEPGERAASVADVVGEVLGELKARAALERVRLVVDESLPEAQVDSAIARAVLFACVSNAITYADAAKQDRWARIEATLREEPGRTLVRFEVEDNGLGIPGGIEPGALDRPFRAHAELRGGTGLGLSIAARLARASGGFAAVRSVEGQGTVQSFLLPTLAVDAED